jgi:hypothetical protein
MEDVARMQYGTLWCRDCVVRCESRSHAIDSGWQRIILVRPIALLPLELLPAHWTESFAAVLIDPSEEAVHVKGMAAFADHYER